MSDPCSPAIILEKVQGGSKGLIINSETLRILRQLMSIPLQTIENECNRVANLYRELWSLQDAYKIMNEYGLEHITYAKGIRELYPPFLLTCPTSIRISILDSYSSPNVRVAAKVYHFLDDPLNPKLEIFLPTLDLTKTTITWIGFENTFRSVIIHEFLHLCGEVKTPQREIIDGVIRHTMVGTEAIEPLLGV